MNNENTKKNNHNIYQHMHLILMTLVVVLPLISSSNSFTQTSLLKITISAFFLALFYLFLAQKLLFDRRLETNTEISLFIMAGFLFFIMVSVLFSQHIYTALWGKYGRFEGFYSWLIYAAVWLGAAGIKWRMRDIKQLIASMSVVAGVISTYGVIQYFGFDFINRQTSFSTGRAFANMGNPVFLGSYLALVFPLALTMYFLTKNKLKRGLYLGINLMIIVAIIATFSRGAWLAAFIGGTAVTVSVVRYQKNSKRLSLKLIAALILIITIFSVVSINTRQNSVNISNRLLSVLSPANGSIASRLEIWRGTINIIGERPFLGYGPGNFAWLYPRYKTLEAAKIEGVKWHVDNAHNWWLQLAATIGLPALTILLIFYFRVIHFALAYKDKNQEMKILMTALAFSLIAYFISLTSGISVMGITILSWLLAGVISSHMFKTIVVRRANYYLMMAFYGIISILMIYLALGYGKYYFAEGWSLKAGNENKMNYNEAAVLSINQAIILVPSEYYYRLRSGKIYIDLSKSTGDIRNFNAAESQLATAVEMNPNDYEGYLFLAGSQYYLSDFNKNSLIKAKNSLETARRLGPREPKMWFYFAVVELQMKNYVLAEKYIRKALLISPNNADFYLIMGKIEERKRLKKKAEDNYKKAIILQPSGASAAEAKKRLDRLK